MRYIRFSFIFSVCFVFLSGLLLSACKEDVQADENESISESSSEVLIEPENTIEIDVEAALKERVLGNPNAAIRISEHSSFTCGHCGKFHRTTFKELKEKYIDTGKAYMVFSDFPLNAPAFHATLSSRCITDDAKYFGYVRELFEQQDKWAYDVGYLSYLKNKASEYGLNEATFEACLNNEELQKELLQRVRNNQTKHGLNSTPSFIINDKDKVTGAVSLEAFEAIFNKTE